MSNSSTFQKYNAVVMNATNRHPAVQLLPEAPRMTDIQRRMFAEQPTDQQLYVKGIFIETSGTCCNHGSIVISTSWC